MSTSKDIFTNAFVDLMASAVGCIVIMMLIFAVQTPTFSRKIGTPRGFVYYSFTTADDNAELEFYFRHGSGTLNCSLAHKKIKDFQTQIGPDTLALCEDFAAYMWGPVQDDFNDHLKKYNFYAVLGKSGDWNFGIRYYDRLTLKKDDIKSDKPDLINEIQSTIKITQHIRTNDLPPVDSSFILRLGDECNLTLKIE